MSRCVSFQNPGVIDPRSYRLFGASAKQQGSNPIGFFGTGLKYAIAIFLRLGCKIELYHGGVDRVVFSTADIQVRDSAFKVVVAQQQQLEADERWANVGEPEELPFTTELGKTWKAWQALRELWCNALDEGGEMQATRLPPREGYTTIIVAGQPVVDAWHEREKIMLTSTPSALCQGVEIHARRGQAVYFRGIRVMDLPRPSKLTYNIVGHPVELTEDRTAMYSYWITHLIKNAILDCTDEWLVQSFIEATSNDFEYSIDMADGEPSELFLKVLEERVKLKVRLNSSILRLYEKHRGFSLQAEEARLTATEEQMLERAREFCRALGLDPDAHPIKVTNTLEDNVLGRADRVEGVVWLTKRCFMQGTKIVAGTLMEELVHMQRGLTDESRPLQNFLVDMIVSMYEEKIGKPL